MDITCKENDGASIRAYRDQYGMNIIGLVPNGIFGENDNFDLNGAPLDN